MIALATEKKIFRRAPRVLSMDEGRQIMNFERSGVTFVFNFNPTGYFEGYRIKVPKGGKYKVILSTDDRNFGGWDRISTEYIYEAEKVGKDWEIPIYLPARTAMCLVKVE